MDSPDPVLAELDHIVRQAGKIAQEARVQMSRELKPDGSVVTDGDRLVEEFLRKELPAIANAPVWGEEFGYALEDRNGLWAVDPVDGTTNYSFGSPIWGVTCALIRGDRAELGAVFLPDLGEMYLARLGGGAWCNGRRLEPIPKGLIEAHHPISYGDSLLRRFPGRRWPGKMRCAGAFVVEGAFVAQQRFRGLIGMREKLYDIAGILALCGELGADIRYASGAPLLMSSLKEDRSLPEPWIVFPAESGFFLEGVASE